MTTHAPSPPHWRSFGSTLNDLGANFRAARPSLVTTLLTACDGAHSGTVSHWTKQSVSRRTLSLLQIVAHTEGSETFAMNLHCQQRGCHEPAFEISVPLTTLMQMQQQSDAGDVNHRFRAPTGEDQEQWLNLPRTPQALETMARSLLINEQTNDDWMQRAEAVLAEIDPLTAFTVTCACPGCEVEATHPVDLEAYALARLQRHQTALINTVHRIATAYGWSEAEIMTLPAWRRAAYDRRIRDAQEEGGGW